MRAFDQNFLQTTSEDLCPATQFALKKGIIVLSNDIIYIRHMFYTKQLINSPYFLTLTRNS